MSHRTLPATALSTALCLLALTAPNALAAPAPPLISATSFSAVGETSATLGATVNPGERVSEYHFEYITQADWQKDGGAFGEGAQSTAKGEIPAEVTATGDLTTGSATIANLTAIAGAFSPGQAISGAGIPAGDTIVAVRATELDLAAPATASAGSVALSATGPQPLPPVTIAPLAPGTAYRVRLFAHNVKGTTLGEEAIFATYAPPPLFGPCPNEAFRTGEFAPLTHPSAALPDCRAYEQASPVQKNGLDEKGRVALVKASPEGNRVSYASAGGAPGGEGAQDLSLSLSTRGGEGWSTQGLLPPEAEGAEAFLEGWTPDFDQTFEAVRQFGGAGGALLSRSSADGSLTPVVGYGEGLGTTSPTYAGGSADGSEALFESTYKLTSTGSALEGKPNLYLWDRGSGQTVLAGVMNDEAPPPQGAFAGPYSWIGAPPSKPDTAQGGSSAAYYTQDEKAISADGQSVYFTAAGSGQLYERVNPLAPQSAVTTNGHGEEECTEAAKACTIHVSESEKENGQGKNGTDAAGSRPAAFVQATPDGSKALLTSSEKLTDDADTGPEAPPASIARAPIGGGSKELSFLPAHAKGVAVDGTHIYWADPEDGTIGRAELDGGEAEPEFVVGAGDAQYVTVAGGFLYWSEDAAEQGSIENEGKGKIGRAKLGAGGAEEEEPGFITGAFHPQGVAVQGEFIYWSNAGSIHGQEVADPTRTIGRAKLGASGAEEVEQQFIEVGGGSLEDRPQGIAVDAAHIYVTIHETQNFDDLFRYDIDGEPSSRITLFDGQGTEVQGLALDATHVYWSRKGADSIGRAKLDFSEPEPEFIKEAGRPEGLAADAEHLYWSANQGSPPNPGNDLYLYDAEANAGERLTDLTVDTEDEDGAQVVGVLGASEDLSTVYFAANGDLDGTGPAQAGDCAGETESAGLSFSGQCSLYVEREGEAPQFIARLEAGGASDAADWLPHGRVIGQLEKTARVSADGRTLLFRSQAKLSAYKNEGVPELYLYRQGKGIACISCNPSGEAPAGTPDLGSISTPAVPPNSTPAALLSRNLNEAGTRAFFETPDRLVAEDTDGTEGCPEVGSSNDTHRSCLDVYEWEAPGTGSCTESPASGYAPQDAGCIYLLSSGKSSDASFLADASASGDDVFLITRSQLVRQDGDQLQDVYDLRVGGGLSAQNPPPSPPPCEAEACKPQVSVPPAGESPPSASFRGPGNPPPKRPKKKHHAHRRRHRHRTHGGSR